VPDKKESLDGSVREKFGGLIGVASKMPVRDNYALSIIYTPGVAEPCKEIARDAELSYAYTWRGNAVAVVGEGSESLPRLESAAGMLQIFAGIDAVPLAVDAAKVRDISRLVGLIEPTFGAVWLLGLNPTDAGRVAERLSDVGIPVIGPPGDDAGPLADPSIYPGLMRAVLDLRLKELERRVVAEASKAGGEAEISFRAAPRVARAAAEKAIELGLAATDVSAEAVEERLTEYLDTGRLRTFGKGEDWLAGDSRRETALRLHASLEGALEMRPKVRPRDPARVASVFDAGDGAAAAIRKSPELADRLTSKGNMVAVVTDGTAVLGLGNIGAGAGLPVMLGKCVLFKSFAGCDAVPICVSATEPKGVIETVEALAPSFGGINLEDISAPQCFEIEDELKKRLDIFVFHDDQHGTAVVTLAGLLNAARLCGKGIDELTVTFNGAGAAGIAVTNLLLAAGVRDVIMCDRAGAIYEGRPNNMNPVKEEMARLTNRDRVKGALADVVRGRNVFIGLSTAGALTGEMIRTMADQPVIFAMANPDPEVLPDEAYTAGAVAVATGRSDFPNQINNCLGFPGIFRGALDVRARSINDRMKLAAAEAIAGLVKEGELRPDYFIPSAMDLRVPPAVAGAIARAAIETGEARVQADPAEIEARTRRFLYDGRLE